MATTTEQRRPPLDPIEDALVRLIRSAELARQRRMAGNAGKEDKAA